VALAHHGIAAGYCNFTVDVDVMLLGQLNGQLKSCTSLATCWYY